MSKKELEQIRKMIKEYFKQHYGKRSKTISKKKASKKKN